MYHKLENCELDINELHDFNDILKVGQWFSEYHIRFYQEIAVPTNTRKRYSTFKNEEIRNYYASCGNHREATRTFKLQDSTVRKICKAGSPDISKHGFFKLGKRGKEMLRVHAGRSFSYPTSVDEELLSWILTMNDLHLPVSMVVLQKYCLAALVLKQAKVGSVISKKDIIYQFAREHLCVRGSRDSLKVRYHHFIPNAQSFSR